MFYEWFGTKQDHLLAAQRASQTALALSPNLAEALRKCSVAVGDIGYGSNTIRTTTPYETTLDFKTCSPMSNDLGALLMQSRFS
jgi:hypothetical protein